MAAMIALHPDLLSRAAANAAAASGFSQCGARDPAGLSAPAPAIKNLACPSWAFVSTHQGHRRVGRQPSR
jgi:hypothetical protein